MDTDVDLALDDELEQEDDAADIEYDGAPTQDAELQKLLHRRSHESVDKDERADDGGVGLLSERGDLGAELEEWASQEEFDHQHHKMPFEDLPEEDEEGYSEDEHVYEQQTGREAEAIYEEYGQARRYVHQYDAYGIEYGAPVDYRKELDYQHPAQYSEEEGHLADIAADAEEDSALEPEAEHLADSEAEAEEEEERLADGEAGAEEEEEEHLAANEAGAEEDEVDEDDPHAEALLELEAIIDDYEEEKLEISDAIEAEMRAQEIAAGGAVDLFKIDFSGELNDSSNIVSNLKFRKFGDSRESIELPPDPSEVVVLKMRNIAENVETLKPTKSLEAKAERLDHVSALAEMKMKKLKKKNKPCSGAIPCSRKDTKALSDMMTKAAHSQSPEVSAGAGSDFADADLARINAAQAKKPFKGPPEQNEAKTMARGSKSVAEGTKKAGKKNAVKKKSKCKPKKGAASLSDTPPASSFFQEDMKVHSPEEYRKFEEATNTTASWAGKLWKDGHLRYCFSSDIAAGSKKIFNEAVAELKRAFPKCFKFTELAYKAGSSSGPENQNKCDTTLPAMFVASGAADGCFSYVGEDEYSIYHKHAQKVNLADPGCTSGLGITMHEVLHALGFSHTQARKDRAKFVKVDMSNVLQGMEANFQEDSKISLDVVPYDFMSIMHYGPEDFAVDPNKPTIEIVGPNPKHYRIGQRLGVSDADIARVHAAYKAIVPGCQLTKRVVSPCVDTKNWADEHGRGCDFYVKTLKEQCKDYSSAQHCCGCGGGVRKVQYVVQGQDSAATPAPKGAAAKVAKKAKKEDEKKDEKVAEKKMEKTAKVAAAAKKDDKLAKDILKSDNVSAVAAKAKPSDSTSAVAAKTKPSGAGLPPTVKPDLPKPPCESGKKAKGSGSTGASLGCRYAHGERRPKASAYGRWGALHRGSRKQPHLSRKERLARKQHRILKRALRELRENDR
eukprot:TRINITY_DN28757_c0_g1_i1.p1 TRINITY_DN28757_c0_g1~~TRINITY_DN28757_c0_g1_i1.p1  ORF type:complete len:1121 (+),score=262.18 TRINITY_DN28757_c0_g1_i1:497-3364(+)